MQLLGRPIQDGLYLKKHEGASLVDEGPTHYEADTLVMIGPDYTSHSGSW